MRAALLVASPNNTAHEKDCKKTERLHQQSDVNNHRLNSMNELNSTYLVQTIENAFFTCNLPQRMEETLITRRSFCLHANLDNICGVCEECTYSAGNRPCKKLFPQGQICLS